MARKRKTVFRKKGGLDFKVKSHILREIWGVVYISLAVLTFLSIRGELGLLGQMMQRFLAPIVGVGIYLLPIIFLVIAVILFLARTINFGVEKTFGIMIFLISILGTVHLSVPLEEAYRVAKEGHAGGYVGFVSSFLALSVLGVVGSYVVFSALFLISVLLVFEVSFGDLLNFINGFQFGKKRVSRQQTFRDHQTALEGTKEDVSDLNIIRPDDYRDDEEEVIFVRETQQSDQDENQNVESSQTQAVSEQPEDASQATFTQDADEDYPWEYPPLDLLDDQVLSVASDDKLLKRNAEKIRDKLAQFGIEVMMQDVHVGPTVMQYTLKPDPGVKLSKIKALKDDLALTLAAPAIRIEAPIPGRSLVGIEVPNVERAIVHLREILESSEFTSLSSKLSLAIGRDVSGKPISADLARMPHLLIAGATGAGKSVCLNTFLLSVLFYNSPKELRLILIDPKRVELSTYNSIPHLLTPVITEPDKAAIALRWAVKEMNRRYRMCAQSGHRSIDEYNADERNQDKMYKIMIVIDELADLMMAAAKEVEASICRVAQMARAVGIHLIVATQRPSVDVITGLIKANIPARIAFTTASSIDSRTILDTIGAEDLLGQGDLLFLSGTMSKPMRVQGIYVSSKEIERVTNRLKLTRAPSYHEEITSDSVADEDVPGIPTSQFQADGSDDDLYQSAVQLVFETKKASASLLQRRLKVGYARAARLLDEMEQNGIVGPADGAKPRRILVE